ncbi:MAG: hypothetical protein LBC71_08375 [Oscillospiraceae bacterium]|jgi:predicted dehydrogenase|nr:hypothetical protein [Oscillospiraceae bacterium]
MQDNIIKEKNWLVGAGLMSAYYAKVLKAQKIAFTTIGRGELSAEEYTKTTGEDVFLGGINKALECSIPETAIVSVSLSELANVTCVLLNKGVKRILLEKPGGVNREELHIIDKVANHAEADVRIAYNRRFYSSTLTAERLIKEDGGVTSFNFEFTEWLHLFKENEKFDGVDILICNSSHVMDMAFFLGGLPEIMNCFAKSIGIKFDDDSTRIYSGAGISKIGALFSYQANWNAPGRWSVEILTRKRRFIFRPLEQLHIQKIGSVAIEKYHIDDTIDIEFKPGLYREVDAFFSGDGLERLPTVNEQLANYEYYHKIQQGE